jgi:hypothetical protein
MSADAVQACVCETDWPQFPRRRAKSQGATHVGCGPWRRLKLASQCIQPASVRHTEADSPVVIELPQFWTAIAKNTDHDAAIRRTAVIRLYCTFRELLSSSHKVCYAIP